MLIDIVRQTNVLIIEKKPSIVNQQRVVYQFKCSFCDENYIGFTMRHLHERCEEHKFNSSSIKKHFNNQHDCLPDNINQHFTVLRKCKIKQDCLIYEMLYIMELSPSLRLCSIGINRFNQKRFRLTQLTFSNRTLFQPFSV